MARHGQITRVLAPALLVAGLCLSMQATLGPAPDRLVRAARVWTDMDLSYDGSYRVIPYPGGDPGGKIGACADLVVRAYRAIGVDLQVLVHNDMKINFKAYPANELYDQILPDNNIDHRRVPNLNVFFKRNSQRLTLSTEPENLEKWKPGDIVIFDLIDNGIPSHIGIISDRKSKEGIPLVIHHLPPAPTEDDCLTDWKVVGHFRYFPEELILAGK